MIQRIQSIFLFLAAALNVTVLFLPLGASSNNDSMEGLTVELTGSSIHKTGLDETTASFVEQTMGFSDHVVLMIHILLVILVSVFLLGVIFLYKDRNRQIKMAYAGVGMLMVQIVISALLFMELPDLAGGGADMRHDIGFGFFFPAVAFLLVWVAAKRIQKDEKMVRDSNRLR